MERNHSVLYSEDPSEHGSEKKKRDPKKRDNFRIPLVPVEHDDLKPEKGRREVHSAFDETLAALVLKRQKESETEHQVVEAKKEDAHAEGRTEEVEAPKSELETEGLEHTAAETTLVEQDLLPSSDDLQTTEAAKQREEAKAEPFELSNHELGLTEFSGGEVIIDLGGTVPVAERVVLLHETEKPEPTPAESQEPVYYHQPEQQHSAKEADHEPVPEVGGAMPPTPPIETWPPTSHYEAPEPGEPERVPEPVASEAFSSQPETVYSTFERRMSMPPVVSGEHVATQQDVEDAVYYATKAGVQRGLVTGMLVGGVYEHLKHRRREKKAEKRFQKQTKQLHEARQDYKFGLQEQERQQSVANRQLAAAERRSSELEQRLAHEKQSERPMPRTPEQGNSENAEQLAAAKGHRLETSAWHTIEVDAKTGKAVEKPMFEYGEEYQRERAPENVGNRFTDEDAVPANAETADDIAAAARIPSASTRMSHPLPPDRLPSANTQGPPIAKDTRKAAAQSPAKTAASTAPVWPWLLALLVIAVLLTLVLR